MSDYAERIEFNGGAIVHRFDPATTEIRFDAGPWTSTTMFVEESDPEGFDSPGLRCRKVTRSAGMRMDDSVWNTFAEAVADNHPDVKELKERASAADHWKALAQRSDAAAPVRAELRRTKDELSYAQRELQRWKDEVSRLRVDLDGRTDDDDVEELKEVIVSQAREIARLKGESA